LADDFLEGINSNRSGFSNLLKFAALGNVTAAISNRVSKGDSVNAQDKDGFTVLMYAARKGSLEAVKLLLSFGANSNIKNHDQQSAADLAKNAGFFDVVKVLTPIPPTLVDPVEVDVDDEPFDLSCWVEDADTLLPLHEVSVGIESHRIQAAIITHKLIDRDEEWGEIQIDLPGKVAWRRKKEQLSVSDKALVKEAIYLGYLNGSIPISLLERIALDEHEELDEVLLDSLVLAFEDLEFKIQDSIFLDRISEAPAEDSHLEDLYDQLVYLIDNNLQDESWFYQRLSIPIGGGDLLTHEEEIDLGKKIDSSYDECIKTLAGNALAINIISEDLRKVLSGLLDPEEIIAELVVVSDEEEGGNLTPGQISIPLEDSEEGGSDEIAAIDSQIKEFIGLVELGMTEVTQAQIRDNLYKLNINFKYIQNLILGGHLQDPVLAFHIDCSIKARNKLVTSNLRLVSHLSRAFRYSELPFADLVQEGFIGLIKAAERFEYKKGFRFTTYATWWIRQSVHRMVQDRSREIRLPVHVGELLNKVDRAERGLMEIPLPLRNQKIAEMLNVSELRVQRVKNAKFTMISIDSESPEDIERLESYEFPAYEDDVGLSNWMLRRSFESIFKSMDRKEVSVIKLRFGWYDGSPLTLEEVGELYGVTRERIRQIEVKVLKRLQGPSALRHLGLFPNKKVSEA
jgi:RNA polymerase primary sigma factor